MADDHGWMGEVTTPRASDSFGRLWRQLCLLKPGHSDCAIQEGLTSPGPRDALPLEHVKPIIKLTTSWSASHCHHAPAILNNASGEIVPSKIKYFVGLSAKHLLWVLLNFMNVFLSLQLNMFLLPLL